LPLAEPGSAMGDRVHTFKRLAAIAGVACLLLGCGGWNDFSNLAAQVKKTPAAEWHRWAAQVIERSKTNSTPVPSSEWPAFLHRIAKEVPTTNWQLAVEPGGSNQQSYVCFYSLGGFQSIGIDVGSASFVETNHTEAAYRVTAIYPGVYLRRSL